MKTGKLALLAAIALIVAWLAVRSRGPGAAPEIPVEASDKPLVSTTEANSLNEHIATGELGRGGPVLTPVPPVEAAQPPPETEPVGSTHLYGFVLPCEGAEGLGESAAVLAVDHLGNQYRSDVGPEGEYSFADLTSGRYWLWAQSRSAGEVRLVVDLDASAGDRRVDLRLEPPLEVLVEVVDTLGAPVRGLPILAVATLEMPGQWIDEVRGSWNGRFGVGSWVEDGFGDIRLPPPVLGRVRLLAPPPVFVSLVHCQRVIETQRLEMGVDRIRFVVDVASPLLQSSWLRFRLVDATTRAVLPRVRTEFQFGNLMTMGLTDESGVCRAKVFPGVVRFRVQDVKRYESAERSVRVEPGAETDLGDIALEAGVSISGGVTDEHGQAIAGASLSYDPVDASQSISNPGQIISVRSNTEGRFQIKGLSRTIYRLTYRGSDDRRGAAVVEVDARGGSVDNVQMQVVPGVALVVRAADGRWQGVRFTVIDSQGLRILTRPLYGPEPQRVLLAPGRYEVETTVAGVVVPARRVIVIEREPVELALP